MLLDFFIPLVAGGVLSIAMVMQHHYGLTSSIMLIFYNNPNGNSNGQQEYGNLFDSNEYIAKRAYEDFGDNEVNGFIQNEDFFEKYSEYF